MILYEVYWIRYFRSNRTMEDMYSSLLGIPVAGAVEVKKLGERLIAEAFASALLMGFLCPSCVFSAEYSTIL